MMTGLFGWFNTDKDTLYERERENLVKNLLPKNFKINSVIYSDSCLVCSFSAYQNIPSKFEKIKGKFIVTCGEIYNNEISKLEKSIIKLYETNELDKLRDYNGTFAAAIYDEKRNKLTLINDRYGLKKLFYYHNENFFCFGPKISPLLRYVPKKSLRKDAILDFFLFGYVLGNKTFFNQINQLPYASILEFSREGLKLKKYWDYEYLEEYKSKSKEVLHKLTHLWEKAVERRIKRNNKIIIPLSGGLDSRAILATALRFTSKDNIVTFTFGEKGSFDFEIGKMVAKKLGVKNISLGVEKGNYEEQYDCSMDDVEGMIDLTPYFSIHQYAKMKDFGDVMFSGTKIDVLLGRHILSDIFSDDLLNKKISSKEEFIEVKELIFKHQKLNDEKEVQKLFHPDFLGNIDLKSSFDNSFKDLNDIISNKNFPNYFALWDYVHRWIKYIYFAVFRNRGLFNYITMLDTDLVDFTLKLAPKLRLNEDLYIKMLLTTYPEIYKLPVKNNFGLNLNAGKIFVFLRRAELFSKRKINEISTKFIKKNMFQEKRLNYLDYDDLLRRDKEYREYMRKKLTKIEERHFFDKNYIEYIWKTHLQGKKNYMNLIGLLVTFELFLERFVD